MQPIAFQLLTDCQDPESLFRSDEWIAEEKLDGDRLMVVKRGNVVECYTRQGNLRDCPQVVAMAMLIDCDFTADGELMPGGHFVAFDIISWNEFSFTNEPIWFRINAHAMPFNYVRSAKGEQAKRDLFEQVKRQCGEGIVFKRVSATYKPGQRTDDWQRLKNYETEPFIVGEVNIRKCSFEVIRDGQSYGHIACGMSNLPLTGETVRIRYEKITKNGKLLRARLAK